MEQRYREIIGRAAMVVMAIGLFAGSVPLLRASWRVGREEAIEQPKIPRMRDRDRYGGYGLMFLAGGVALDLAGLYLVVLALMSHRNLDKHPPKAPVLWGNPEPGRLSR